MSFLWYRSTSGSIVSDPLQGHFVATTPEELDLYLRLETTRQIFLTMQEYDLSGLVGAGYPIKDHPCFLVGAGRRVSVIKGLPDQDLFCLENNYKQFSVDRVGFQDWRRVVWLKGLNDHDQVEVTNFGMDNVQLGVGEISSGPEAAGFPSSLNNLERLVVRNGSYENLRGFGVQVLCQENAWLKHIDISHNSINGISSPGSAIGFAVSVFPSDRSPDHAHTDNRSSVHVTFNTVYDVFGNVGNNNNSVIDGILLSGVTNATMHGNIVIDTNGEGGVYNRQSDNYATVGNVVVGTADVPVGPLYGILAKTSENSAHIGNVARGCLNGMQIQNCENSVVSGNVTADFTFQGAQFDRNEKLVATANLFISDDGTTVPSSLQGTVFMAIRDHNKFSDNLIVDSSDQAPLRLINAGGDQIDEFHATGNTIWNPNRNEMIETRILAPASLDVFSVADNVSADIGVIVSHTAVEPGYTTLHGNRSLGSTPPVPVNPVVNPVPAGSVHADNS